MNDGKPIISAASSGKGKFFDVAPPGATIASANARPVITNTMQPKVQDNINGISAPSPARVSSRPSNPDETHKQLIGSKTRVVVQPTGTLNKGSEPSVTSSTSALSPSVPEPEPSDTLSPPSSVAFDISSLSTYEYAPQEKTGAASESPDAPSPTQPQSPAKPNGAQPTWVKDAEKYITTDPGNAAAPVASQLIATEKTASLSWRWPAIIALAVVVAIVVMTFLVMIFIQLS